MYPPALRQPVAAAHIAQIVMARERGETDLAPEASLRWSNVIDVAFWASLRRERLHARSRSPFYRNGRSAR